MAKVMVAAASFEDQIEEDAGAERTMKPKEASASSDEQVEEEDGMEKIKIEEKVISLEKQVDEVADPLPVALAAAKQVDEDADPFPVASAVEKHHQLGDEVPASTGTKEMECCLICKKSTEPLTTLTDKGCSKINRTSERHGTDILALPGQRVHEVCRGRYIYVTADIRQIERNLHDSESEAHSNTRLQKRLEEHADDEVLKTQINGTQAMKCVICNKSIPPPKTKLSERGCVALHGASKALNENIRALPGQRVHGYCREKYLAESRKQLKGQVEISETEISNSDLLHSAKGIQTKECIICKKTTGQKRTLSEMGSANINSVSEARNDDIYAVPGQCVHSKCNQRYLYISRVNKESLIEDIQTKECIICKKITGQKRILQERGCASINKASEVRKDKIEAVPGQCVHITCINRYVHIPKIIKALKSQENTETNEFDNMLSLAEDDDNSEQESREVLMDLKEVPLEFTQEAVQVAVKGSTRVAARDPLIGKKPKEDSTVPSSPPTVVGFPFLTSPDNMATVKCADGNCGTKFTLSGHSLCPSHAVDCQDFVSYALTPFKCVPCMNLLTLCASDAPVSSGARKNAVTAYKSWITKLKRVKKFSLSSQVLYSDLPFLKNLMTDKKFKFKLADLEFWRRHGGSRQEAARSPRRDDIVRERKDERAVRSDRSGKFSPTRDEMSCSSFSGEEQEEENRRIFSEDNESCSSYTEEDEVDGNRTVSSSRGKRGSSSPGKRGSKRVRFDSW